MKKILLCPIFIILSLNMLFAQRYFGVATSEYNTINSLYLNPANLAGCKEKLSINLSSINLTIDNSLGTFNSLGSTINNLSSSNNANSIFTYSNRARFSMLLPEMEIRGPSVLYSINDNNTVAITTRIRVFNQFNDFDKNLYNYITQPNFTSNGNYGVNINGFNWTADVWTEIGLSYGGVILDNSKITLKGGATIRYLMGTGFISLSSNNFNVTYYPNGDSLYAQNSDLEYASTAESAKSAILNGASGGGILNNFLGSPIGAGVGADLGLILVLRPFSDGLIRDKGDEDGNHRIVLSASVTDIGAITYKAGNTFAANFTGNGYLTANGLANNISNFSEFKSYVVNQGFHADTNSGAKKALLPTALVLGGDYNIYKKFYVNATMVSNLVNRNNLGNSIYSQFTITPRFDTKIVTVGMPVTYDMLTDNVRLGLGVRFGGFMIGCDDMLFLLANRQYGFNIYFGGYVPIFKKQSSSLPTAAF